MFQRKPSQDCRIPKPHSRTRADDAPKQQLSSDQHEHHFHFTILVSYLAMSSCSLVKAMKPHKSWEKTKNFQKVIIFILLVSTKKGIASPLLKLLSSTNTNSINRNSVIVLLLKTTSCHICKTFLLLLFLLYSMNTLKQEVLFKCFFLFLSKYILKHLNQRLCIL